MGYQDKTALYAVDNGHGSAVLADAWARLCSWLSACEPEVRAALRNGLDQWLELQTPEHEAGGERTQQVPQPTPLLEAPPPLLNWWPLMLLHGFGYVRAEGCGGTPLQVHTQGGEGAAQPCDHRICSSEQVCSQRSLYEQCKPLINGNKVGLALQS